MLDMGFDLLSSQLALAAHQHALLPAIEALLAVDLDSSRPFSAPPPRRMADMWGGGRRSFEGG
eukprot:3377267-Rhodomonas_salina.1